MSKRTTVCGVEIGEFDQVRIWGESSWPEGVTESGFLCTVSTISTVPQDEDDYPAIKVWPHDNAHPSGGKVWFPIDKITKLEMVQAE